MKKFIISACLILVFAVYIYHTKFDKGDGANLVKPASLSSSANSSPADTTIGSSTSTSTQSSSDTPQTPTSTQTQTPTPPPTTKTKGLYADGSYTGSVEDAFYGLVQVKAVVSGGKITDVAWLQYPNDQRESRQINSQADPWLTQEAIAAQSANVDVISGATQSSEAFIRSLTTALAGAKA